jgi:hypothetical protein
MLFTDSRGYGTEFAYASGAVQKSDGGSRAALGLPSYSYTEGVLFLFLKDRRWVFSSKAGRRE